MGSNLAASSQSIIRCAVVANRSTVLRAWCTSRPGVLKIKKRSRFGRAVNKSAGSARRFSAVITLCEITANRSHAAFAPKYLHGITPPASSFFTTSCTPSTVPAFSRCHWIKRPAFHSPMFVTTTKCFTLLPSSNKVSCRCRTCAAPAASSAAVWFRRKCSYAECIPPGWKTSPSPTTCSRASTAPESWWKQDESLTYNYKTGPSSGIVIKNNIGDHANGYGVPGTSSWIADHEHRRRLLAARIATGVVAGLEGGEEPLGEIALCGLEGTAHGLRHLRAYEDVALRGPGLALAVARPVRRVGAGESGDVTLMVDDGHLAAILAGEGVVGEEFVDHLSGGESLAEQYEAARAVAHIDVGLGSDAAGAGLGPGHHGADGKVLGGDGDAAIAGGGVVGHDGEGIDVSGGQRERREEAEQDSVHRDCYITAATACAGTDGVKGRWHDNRHTLVTELSESGAGDEVIMSIAGHVSRAMLSRYSHVRIEAKRRALDEIAARQNAADEKRKEEAERREQAAAASPSAVIQ